MNQFYKPLPSQYVNYVRSQNHISRPSALKTAVGLGLLGAVIGTAICPGLGTAIGAKIGAAKGTVAGGLFAALGGKK